MKDYEKIHLDSEVTPVPLTKSERTELYQLAKNHAVRRPKFKIILATAATFVLFISFISPGFRTFAADIFEQVRISFSEAFGSPSTGDDYAYKLHEKVKFGDLEFVVEDIVPMDNTVYLSMIFDRNQGVLFENVIHYASINGVRQEVNFWPISMENLTEDGRMTLTTSEIIFDEPLPENPFDLTIEFKDKKGSYAELHAHISQDQLQRDIIELAKDVTIPDTDGIILRELKLTPVAQVGKLEIPTEIYFKVNFDHLEAEDSKGKIAYFYVPRGYLDEDKNVVVNELLYSKYSSTMTADELMKASKLTWRAVADDRQTSSEDSILKSKSVIGRPFVLKNPKVKNKELN